MNDFPVYRVIPVLVYYGGDEVSDGYGWKAYACPFHGDRSASASVNTQDQLFNCHAGDCPKGNAVQIVMKQEGLTYGDAVIRTKQISGQVDQGPSPSQRGRGSGGSRFGGSRSGGRRWSRAGR